MRDPDNRDGVAILVRASSMPARTMRVNITLADKVLTAIDRYSEAHGLTRSGFLSQAAQEAMKAGDH